MRDDYFITIMTIAFNDQLNQSNMSHSRRSAISIQRIILSSFDKLKINIKLKNRDLVSIVTIRSVSWCDRFNRVWNVANSSTISVHSVTMVSVRAQLWLRHIQLREWLRHSFRIECWTLCRDGPLDTVKLFVDWYRKATPSLRIVSDPELKKSRCTELLIFIHYSSDQYWYSWSQPIYVWRYGKPDNHHDSGLEWRWWKYCCKRFLQLLVP